MTAIAKSRGQLRRFTKHSPALTVIKAIAADHKASVNASTIYPATVLWPGFAERLLKSGEHNRKIGAEVRKGPWRGMPIFTLTLEERATCPRTCLHWQDCFGNKMHFSTRLMHGQALEHRLGRELAALAKEHPAGFVVRLHVLGDFYSVSYVRRWLAWLRRFPMLHIFGYSAWPPSTEIGALVHDAARRFWDRFAIRHSNGVEAERCTVTLYHLPPTATFAAVDGVEVTVCPAQTNATDCCATCGLCWGTTRNIAFLAH